MKEESIRKLSIGKLFILLLLLLFPLELHAGTVFITDIVDGDSLRGRLDGERVKTELRLWGIDSPEWNQLYGDEAKRYLKKRILRKNVSYASRGRDRYDRLFVIIYEQSSNGKLSINEELVANGFAWVYKRFCNEAQCEQWLKSQEKAEKQREGLWVREEPVPPWQFKKKNKYKKIK